MAVVLDSSVYQLPDRSWVDKRYQRYGKTQFQMADIDYKIAEELGKLKLPESWKEGNDILNKYLELFGSASRDFSKGMTAKNAAALLDARRMFAEKIVPIKQAVDRYNTILDMITKAGGDAIVGNGDLLSLELIYKNGAVHAPLRTISRQLTVNGASQYFKGIETLLAKDPTFKTFLGAALDKMMMTREGFSADDLLTMALSDYVQNSNSPLSDAVRKYLDSYINGLGVGDFDEAGMSKVRGAALEGMVRAFQQDRSSVVANNSWSRDMQLRRLQQDDAHFYAGLNQRERHHNDSMRNSGNKSTGLKNDEYVITGDDGNPKVVRIKSAWNTDGTSTYIVQEGDNHAAVSASEKERALKVAGLNKTVPNKPDTGNSRQNGGNLKVGDQLLNQPPAAADSNKPPQEGTDPGTYSGSNNTRSGVPLL